MDLIRTYYNALDEIIRADTIIMERKLCVMIDGVDKPTFFRNLRIEKVYNRPAGYGPPDRTVATIEVSGDFDTIDDTTGNFEWANWEFGGTTVRCNMTDLPAVGTVV